MHGRGEKCCSLGWKTNGRNHVEDVGIDGIIILKCTINKLSVRVWTGFIWLRIGNMVMDI
jgi:hypothetical protein